jgi:uncharacterized protein YcbX
VSITVSALSITPVKGLRLRDVERIDLTLLGALGDRRFYIVDDRGRMVNSKVVDRLQSVVAEWSQDTGELTLEFPDGARVGGVVETGEQVTTRFFSRERTATLLDGPWAGALSDYFGRPLAVVGTDNAVDRGTEGAASLMSGASVRRLADAACEPSVDARRFRMLIEVEGVEAHAEDAWVGREVRVGEALVRFNGHVGRCLVTGMDPATGVTDLPTLDLLRGYRDRLQSTEPLPFGIYGEIVEPGAVRVGDTVRPLTP